MYCNESINMYLLTPVLCFGTPINLEFGTISFDCIINHLYNCYILCI